MDWKGFFRPAKSKVLISITLAALSLLYKRPNYCFDANCYPRGLPLPFIDEVAGSLNIAHDKYIGFFVIDIIIWFLVACLTIYLFKKFKK